MRTTIGLAYWLLLKNCRLAASPRIWSQALWKYARYWISGIGSMPMLAKPWAMPRIMVSSSRVLNTRRGPNAFCRPLVTVYTPPFCATSSPNSSVSGYLARSLRRVVDLDRRAAAPASPAACPRCRGRDPRFAVRRAASFATLSRRVRRQRRLHVFSVSMRGRLSAPSAAANHFLRVSSWGEDLVLRHQPSSGAICAERSGDRRLRPATGSSIERHSISKSVPAWPMMRRWCAGAGTSGGGCGGNARPSRSTSTVAGGEVETIGEVVEVRAVAEALRDPAARRLHRRCRCRCPHTYSTGAGSFWYTVHEAALNAVCAVAWFADASPNEQIAMESSGIGSWWPMRLAASIATAVPSASAGGKRSSRSAAAPQRLAAPDLVPPARGRVFRARREGQRRIHDRVHARQLAEAFGHEAAAARSAGTPGRCGASRARPSRCLRGRWNRWCRRPCSARAARAIRSRWREINCGSNSSRKPFASAHAVEDGFARRRG